MIENEDTTLWLNKFVAQTGISNRKQAVDLIKKGEISVNGEIIKEPFYKVKETDAVTFKGNILKKIVKFEYFLINKSKSTPINSQHDDLKPSVQSIMTKHTINPLKPVENLQDDSCGLMLMTNDETLLSKLNLQTTVRAVYEIELDKPLDLADMHVLSQAQNDQFRIVNIDFPDESNKMKIGLVIVGGNVSALKQIFEEKQYHLTKVDCMAIGALTKKDLKRGWARKLTEKEVIFLKHFG